eukprot:2486935-Pyramimonas_sp.AAC.1
MKDLGIQVDGILLDIGISSPQLDGDRGFRPEMEGALDLRFDVTTGILSKATHAALGCESTSKPETANSAQNRLAFLGFTHAPSGLGLTMSVPHPPGVPAHEFLQTVSAEDLEEILVKYGGEDATVAQRIADMVVFQRQTGVGLWPAGYMPHPSVRLVGASGICPIPSCDWSTHRVSLSRSSSSARLRTRRALWNRCLCLEPPPKSVRGEFSGKMAYQGLNRPFSSRALFKCP